MSGAMNHNHLIEHGIAEDESDYRIHVDLGGGRVYVFSTEAGRASLRPSNGCRPFAATQPGVGGTITGAGYRINWRDIDGCVQIRMPRDIMMSIQCSKDSPPNIKGAEAKRVALAMFERQCLYLPPIRPAQGSLFGATPSRHDGMEPSCKVREVRRRRQQIKGIDLVTDTGITAQIKCDWRCTSRGLALQTHEINPHGLLDDA